MNTFKQYLVVAIVFAAGGLAGAMTVHSPLFTLVVALGGPLLFVAIGKAMSRHK